MCIAVLCTKGTMLTPEQLWSGWVVNGDGGGFAYVDESNKVVIEKGFMKYNPFQKRYDELAKKYSNTSPFLVHMRIRTSGTVSAKNCHPFPIKGGALIHNGIMFTPTGNMPEHDRKSDTRIFAESLYNILALEDIKKGREDLEKAIGWGNKVALLYDNREFAILGEDEGTWEKGIWYSNSSCSRKAWTPMPKAED